jgi:hypothetical protein
VPVLVVLSLGAGGCGLLGKEASRWGPDAAKVVDGAGPGVNAIHLGDEAERTRINQLLRDAPKQPTADEAATLSQLNALNDFESAVDSVDGAYRVRLSSADPAVPQVAQASLVAPVPREEFDFLVEQGRDILKDAACDLAWQLMQPDEQVAANGLYGSGYTRAVPVTVDRLETMTREVAVDAIANAARNGFLKQFFPTDTVDWFSYAEGLYGKAADLTSDGGARIAYPGHGWVTRAMVYYVRTCMVPPR